MLRVTCCKLNREKVLSFKLLVFSFIFVIFILSSLVYAGSIEEIQILKITPKDERAVIKMPDGRMQIVRTGDLLRVASYELKDIKKQVSGYELRVMEIAKGRVVFEEKTDKGIEMVIIRVEDEKTGSELRVAGSEAKKQRIERIRKVPEERPQLYAPK